MQNVLQTLKKVVADEEVSITVKADEGASPASPMRADIMKEFNRLTDSLWPGVVTLPSMAVGASDGRYLRAAGIPIYGLSGIFNERDDNRAHGRDERMLVRSYFEGQTFMYEIVKALAKPAN